jgi:hypothetical protein
LPATLDKYFLTKTNFMNAKHFYIITSSLLLSTVCQAQIVKGDKLLGGSIGFITANQNSYVNGGYNSSYRAANFTVAYGKAFKNNTVTGINASFGYSNQPAQDYNPATGISTFNNRNINAGIGVFKRRYVPLGKSFYFFGQLGGDINYGNIKTDRITPGNFLDTYTFKSYGVNLSLYPGISYQLNNRFMLDLTLASLVNIGYSHTDTEIRGQGKQPVSNTLYLNSNLSLNSLGNISVGFRVLFHNKKSNKNTGS